ncbi:hypothetical protein G9A89_007721 [Geosiphon pyriformis]|nr:hypothetical protein G9A89_007721 [Geosiphon pyriformis]
MEEECLVEETSFNYGKDNALAEGDHNQTPTGSKVKTKKALGKPLRKIDFSSSSNDDNAFLDTPLVLSLPVKNLVNISVQKSFALDIGLDKVVRKSFYKKLQVVRKLFSRINGFGGASTLSKFAGIVKVMFISELSLIKATKLATDVKILVNTDLKILSGHSDWAVGIKEIPVGTLVETVCAVLSKFGIIKSVKIQLVGLWNLHKALLYTLPVGTNAHNIWNHIGSVDGKTCIINHHPVTYARARYAIVCFGSAESLNVIISTALVLRGAHFHWFCLGSAVCAKCGKVDHTSLGCASGERIFSGSLLCWVLSDANKSRLAAIYAKCSVPVSCLVFFGDVSWAKIVVGSSFLPLPVQNVLLNNDSSSEMKLTLQVSLELNNRFVTLECSLTSLAEHVNKLVKRLDTLGPMVFQLSPGPDIVINKGLGVAISDGTVVGVVDFDASVISKMEEMLCNLSVMVMSLLTKMDNADSSINVSAKQKDVVCWHRESGNLVSIITETKLRSSCRPWIKNRFDGVWVFTSGLDASFLGAGVAIIMNVSLAHHVCRISEVSGQLLFIKLLFKNRLLVSILGLYAGVSLAVHFAQADKVNSMIVKAVNKFSFVILSSDFNEDGSHKCTSFKKCFDIGLVNSLGKSSFIRVPTWTNS